MEIINNQINLKLSPLFIQDFVSLTFLLGIW